MNLSEQIEVHYLMTPHKSSKPIKVDKVLEERLRRHRYARELRLVSLEKA